MLEWAIFLPAFLTAAVEGVEAFTIVLAVSNNVETRYTAPTTPAIELVVTLGVLSLLRRRRQSGLGDIQPITAPSAPKLVASSALALKKGG